MAIKAVGFDYLGVTAHLTGRSVFELIGERLALNAEFVKDAYQQFSPSFQRGDITQNQLWQRIAGKLDRPDDLAIILAAADEDQPKADPEILSLVDDVRSRGYKTGLLSNLSTGTSWDAGLYAQGVDKHFDAVILSGDLGVSKPDLRAYQALTDALEVGLDQLVFIDDRPSSMVGIDEAGVLPIVYTGHVSLFEQLNQLGILS